MTKRIRLRARAVADARLRQSLPPKRQELKRRIDDHDAGAEPWAVTAERLFDLAETEQERGDFEAAWALFLTGSRMEILDYSPEELEDGRRALLAEAEVKLNSWRRHAVLELLGKSHRDVKAGRAALQLATSIRDEAASNQWRIITSLRHRLMALGLVLLAAIVTVLVLVAVVPVDFAGDPSDEGWQMWALAAAFGALGGSVSALRSVTASGLGGRVPRQTQEWYVTAVRPLVGAAAALGVFVLFAEDITSASAMLGLAFAAGFSESLVVRRSRVHRGGRASAHDAAARRSRLTLVGERGCQPVERRGRHEAVWA